MKYVFRSYSELADGEQVVEPDGSISTVLAVGDEQVMMVSGYPAAGRYLLVPRDNPITAIVAEPTEADALMQIFLTFPMTKIISTEIEESQ